MFILLHSLLNKHCHRKNPWLLETSVQLWVEMVKQNNPPQPFLLPSFPLCKILPGPTQKAGFVQESKPNVLPSKNVITMRKPSFPGNRKPFNFRARLASVSKIKKEGGLWESSVCCNLLPGIWGLLFHLGDTWST